MLTKLSEIKNLIASLCVCVCVFNWNSSSIVQILVSKSTFDDVTAMVGGRRHDAMTSRKGATPVLSMTSLQRA